MREIQLWDAGEGLHDTFQVITKLAAQCKFSDCQHKTEPSFAVKRTINERTLSEARLESYRKLQRELIAVERKKKPALMAAERKKWKKLGHMAKEIRKKKAGDL